MLSPCFGNLPIRQDPLYTAAASEGNPKNTRKNRFNWLTRLIALWTRWTLKAALHSTPPGTTPLKTT